MYFKVKKFNQFINENIDNKVYSGEDVWNYFSKIVSKHHSKIEDPIHQLHKEQILNNTYVLRDIKIDDLIKHDIDVQSFVETQFDYYKEKWNKNTIKSYGLIGDNDYASDVLIDGYHRLMQTIINGDNTFKVFVPLNSKFY